MVVRMNPLTLFRRPPTEPEPEYVDDPAAEDTELDVPPFDRGSGEWRSGLRYLRYRPLTWTSTPPRTEGFRHARMPGADRFTVVQVTRDSDGVLVYGISAVRYRPVEGSELEWGTAVIQEPAG